MTAPSQPDSTPDDAAGIVGITRLFFRCGYCGKKVESTRTRKKFCSPQCAGLSTTVEPKQCLHCGKAFKAKNGSQTLCSIECRHLHIPLSEEFIAHQKQSVPRLELTCKNCGKSFTQRRPEHIDSYCSDACISVCLGKGPKNYKSKVWRFRDPRGRIHEFKNLEHFIRQNSDLFDADDVIWRPKGKQETCRAKGGLESLSPRKKNAGLSWKGWAWWSIQERIHGADFLNRKNAKL